MKEWLLKKWEEWRPEKQLDRRILVAGSLSLFVLVCVLFRPMQGVFDHAILVGRFESKGGVVLLRPEKSGSLSYIPMGDRGPVYTGYVYAQDGDATLFLDYSGSKGTAKGTFELTKGSLVEVVVNQAAGKFELKFESCSGCSTPRALGVAGTGIDVKESKIDRALLLPSIIRGSSKDSPLDDKVPLATLPMAGVAFVMKGGSLTPGAITGGRAPQSAGSLDAGAAPEIKAAPDKETKVAPVVPVKPWPKPPVRTARTTDTPLGRSCEEQALVGLPCNDGCYLWYYYKIGTHFLGIVLTTRSTGVMEVSVLAGDFMPRGGRRPYHYTATFQNARIIEQDVGKRGFAVVVPGGFIRVNDQGTFGKLPNGVSWDLSMVSMWAADMMSYICEGWRFGVTLKWFPRVASVTGNINLKGDVTKFNNKVGYMEPIDGYRMPKWFWLFMDDLTPVPLKAPGRNERGAALARPRPLLAGFAQNAQKALKGNETRLFNQLMEGAAKGKYNDQFAEGRAAPFDPFMSAPLTREYQPKDGPFSSSTSEVPHLERNQAVVMGAGGYDGMMETYVGTLAIAYSDENGDRKSIIFRNFLGDTVNLRMVEKYGTMTTHLIAENNDYRLAVTSSAPTRDFMDLRFNEQTGQKYLVHETLKADGNVKLYKKRLRSKGRACPDTRSARLEPAERQRKARRSSENRPLASKGGSVDPSECGPWEQIQEWTSKLGGMEFGALEAALDGIRKGNAIFDEKDKKSIINESEQGATIE